MTTIDASTNGQEPAVIEAHRSEARADWERRIYRRLTDTSQADPSLALPAPVGLTAVAGVGHVRLEWAPVEGAAGYVVERTVGADGAAEMLHHGGSDVAAVPACRFADTGVPDGTDLHYRVGAVAGGEQPVWAWSQRVTARTSGAGPTVPVLDVSVDAGSDVGRLQRVWSMVGSERLSQLRLGLDEHGHDIGAEFAEALRRARTDLGVEVVRAHAILHDDNRVVTRDSSGELHLDFTLVDGIYDQLLELGLRPVVELSFMPRELAADPDRSVFTYGAVISPPSDWGQWRRLVAALAEHLVERYGIEDVARWSFEVWNEPNLVVFWSGTRQDYLRLYDESARALKGVDARLRVGGPSTAATEWVEELAAHAEEGGVPLDFVSTHTYGNLPLDTRPVLLRHGFGGLPVWWTEWGVGSTHFGDVHDGVFGAPFVLSGFASAQGRVDALAYWVVSDHFEELGRPPRLFHNGFGLLSVGNLRKPRYWGVHLAAHLGDTVLASRVDGDGADVLVEAWATRHDDGTVDVLLWNGTINAALVDGDLRLDRWVRLTLTGLPAARYRVDRALVDRDHSNIVAQCPDGVDWPDDELWAELRARDRLFEERLDDLLPAGGTATFELPLPMPGIARFRLAAASDAADTV